MEPSLFATTGCCSGKLVDGRTKCDHDERAGCDSDHCRRGTISASTAVQPLVQGLANEAWERYPVRPLAPGIAAALVAREIMTMGQGKAEAARSGIDGSRFESLVAEARNPPPIELAYELWRRGEISGDEFGDILARNGVLPRFRDALRRLRNIVPSVTDLVRMAVREVFDPAQRAALDLDAEFPGEFARRAAELGISRELAGDYWAAHWDLPSYSQLTEMRFRGLLNPAEYRSALRAIDIAPVWRDKLFEIARRIPTLPDMVRFAVREVYNPPLRRSLGYEEEFPEEFAKQAELHGMRREHAQQYWYAHWRLPSARQGYQMVWRGEMGPDELRTLLKALDYPPKWRERLFNIAFIKPGRIDLKRMLRHGIKTPAEVEAGYRAIGYAPDDAKLMRRIAEAETAGGTGESPFVATARRRLYTVAHTEYLDESIDEAAARDKLAALGVVGADRDTIIRLWNEEAEIRRRELTPSQLRKAYKTAALSEAETLARLEDAGMTPDDARIFLASG